MRSVNSTFDNYVRLNKKIPPEMVTSIAAVDDPAYLADKLVGHLGIKLEDKQALLECDQSGRAAREDPRLHALGAGNPRGRKAHPLPGQEADGEDPEGVLPQRADAGDSEGTRREGRIQERDPGARRKAAPEEDAGRGAREVRARDQEAQDDVADVGRGDRGPQLSRLVPRAALVRVHRGQARHQGSRAHPRGRPLRAREGQAAHPRIPRGADPGRPDEGTDPVPGRTSGRRQDLAGQVDRARDRTQVRARLARRRARRGRNPRPSPHLHRRAARQGHPVACARPARATR